MLRIRPYKSNDSKFIVNWISTEEEFVKWCANLINYPFTEESMEITKETFEKNENGWLFTAIDKNGLPIGFLSMSKADYENNSVHLGFIIVDSSKRNNGYGKEMIRVAIKYAFEILNVSRVTLKVFDNNPRAHACYKSLGFIDEKYEEKSFPYKDQLWGCYHMAIEK